MRFMIVALLLAACGDHAGSPQAPAPTAADLPALAFAPANPTYVLAAPSARTLLAFAPIPPPAGIDLDASAAVFSDHLDPTLVVHLSDPAAARAALAQLPPTMWNIANDWLAIHFEIFGDAPSWMQRGHGLAGDAWAWAKQHAGVARDVLGFVDLHALAARVPRVGAALACVQLVEPLGRVGVSASGDPSHASIRVQADLGSAAAAVATAILPPPAGWAAAAHGAPLAAELNVDLQQLAAWAAPCERALAIDRPFGDTGVRAARVMLTSLDAHKHTGTGAIALDLTRKDTIAQLLDQIPMRAQLESDHAFGAHAGHRITIPFTATIDYVLEDHLALAAMGDGLLDRIVASPTGAAPVTDAVYYVPARSPLFSLDVVASGLPQDAWAWLVKLAGMPHAVADVLAATREAHASVTLDGSDLVLRVSVTR